MAQKQYYSNLTKLNLEINSRVIYFQHNGVKGSTFTTDSESVQAGIENHSLFGSVIFLASQKKNPVKPVAPADLDKTAPTDLDETDPTDLDETAPTDLDETAPTDLDETDPTDLDKTVTTDSDKTVTTDLGEISPVSYEDVDTVQKAITVIKQICIERDKRYKTLRLKADVLAKAEELNILFPNL